ncbi:MAG TPA: LacI family DNA-binding transcriptional regulator [Acidimicrobiales bacterium]|nr:LacI family DNA-binding transcriptional regulator [Acidimicrobiales bacterium]
MTLAEVARRAGVSQTTASFVLTGRGDEMRISQQVRVRVEQAVRETGYRPNVVSRSLRTGTTHTIGFVSDTVATTPFAGHLIWGALDAARESEHLLLIAETEGDPELEKEMIDAMRDRGVDGIVLASMYTRWATIPKGLLDGPSVLLNALPAKPCAIASVIPDELGAGRTAARTLLAAGHTDGIYVVGAGPRLTQVPKGVVAAAERLAGIKEVLDAANVELAGGVSLRDWQPTFGYEATRKFLQRKPELKALICFNDRLSVGAYNALEDAGRKVGQDVSVVSFDDEPVASWLRPQLTSISLPHYELGRKAIEILMAGNPEQLREGRVHRVPMPLRKRESVARPKRLPDRSGRE